MSILKESKKSFVGSAGVYIAMGLLMCVWPVGVSNLMCFAAGAFLTAGGAWKIARYFRTKEYGLSGRADFAAGALEAIVGLLLLSRPNALVELVPVLLGVMVLVNSVFQIQVSLELKKLTYTGWWHHLAVALICAAVSVAMMFNPFRSYEVLSVILGAAFVVDGAADLWTALYVRRKLKKMNLM